MTGWIHLLFSSSSGKDLLALFNTLNSSIKHRELCQETSHRRNPVQSPLDSRLRSECWQDHAEETIEYSLAPFGTPSGPSVAGDGLPKWIQSLCKGRQRKRTSRTPGCDLAMMVDKDRFPNILHCRHSNKKRKSCMGCEYCIGLWTSNLLLKPTLGMASWSLGNFITNPEMASSSSGR